MRGRIILAAGLGLALAVTAWLWWGPGPGLTHPAVVEVPQGTSHRAIAARLAEAGAIRSAWAFDLWALLHRRDHLHAGTYRFAGGEPLARVYGDLAAGRTWSIRLLVAEGFNRFDIARAMDAAGIAGSREFLAITARPDLARPLDPQAVSLEGYLYPDTYAVSPLASPQQIAAMMVARFRQQLARERPRLGGTLPPLHAWLTLASLVERETGNAAERPLVAGVFVNRLARGLPLQCDPTVIYAALLAGRYTGVIRKSDLDFRSPYNTYAQPGLPPGPIANPGQAALEAAARPAATPYLYFVSDAHGGHRFAITLADHNKNVALYRAAVRPH